MKKRLWQILQICLTAGVLIWLFHDPEKRASMFSALRRANGWWLLAGLVSAFLSEAAGILRWQQLLKAQTIDPGLSKVGRWYVIGLFFNMFLPGTTGGDAAKLFYLWRCYPEKRQGALLSLVADRLVGVIPLIVAVALGTLLKHRWLMKTPATTTLLYSTLIFCGAMALILWLGFAFSGGRDVPRWLPAREKFADLARAWGLFTRDKRQFATVLLLSVPVLLGYYGEFYCASHAVDAGISWGEMFSLMPIVAVGSALPISVAGLGIREGLFERLLGDLCGTPPDTASLISLLGFLMFSFYGLLGALVYLFSPRVESDASEKQNSR